ncbi:MAG: hypothetical protein AB1482_11160 [Pseudomonadota bacterium]
MQIRLALPHTHAGRDYPPGAVLDLDADAAAWLVALGVAEAHQLPADTLPHSSTAPDPARKPPRSKP